MSMVVNEMIYVIVTGGRDWKDEQTVFHELERIYADQQQQMMVIQGGCIDAEGKPAGADAIAQEWCKFREVPCLTWPARWKHGTPGNALSRAEGPLRNRAMAKWLRSLLDAFGYTQFARPVFHRVLGFWDGQSKGTLNCLKEAESFGLEIEVFGPGKARFDQLMGRTQQSRSGS